MQSFINLLPLILLIVMMYFLMIRPQRKKDKQIQEMRRGLSVGDEIITIGGICGKIVKTKDETIVIQVGADKVKFEMMRWAVSSVTSSNRKAKEEAERVTEDEEPKKVMPKRLRKAADIDEEEQEKAQIQEMEKEDKPDDVE